MPMPIRLRWPYLLGALPKLEVLDLQENGKITDAQALVAAF